MNLHWSVPPPIVRKRIRITTTDANMRYTWAEYEKSDWLAPHQRKLPINFYSRITAKRLFDEAFDGTFIQPPNDKVD